MLPSAPFRRGVIFAAALFCSHPALSLTVLTEENPPLNYTEDGKVTGYATEVVAEMGRRAKIPMTFELTAWDRAYPRAQGEKDTCLYSTARLPERERLFQWAGPVAFNRWGVYGRNDFAHKIASVEDLKPHRIGAVRFDAKAQYLNAKSVVNVLLVSEDRENVPRLFLPKTDADAIDLWVTSLGAPRHTAGDRAKSLKLVFIIRDAPSFLACSPYVPAATVAALAQALDAMNKDGTTKKIAAKYEARFAAQ